MNDFAADVSGWLRLTDHLALTLPPLILQDKPLELFLLRLVFELVRARVDGDGRVKRDSNVADLTR